MLHKLIVGIGFMLMLSNCSTNSSPSSAQGITDSVASNKASATETLTSTDCLVLKANARKMDSSLLKQMNLDRTLGNAAIKAFLDFAHYCQQDSACPIFLIKTAQVAQALQNYEQAKIALETCIANYPNFKNKAAALFLLGQLYDEVTQLNDENKARSYYLQIIKDYPRTEWATSAEGAMALLGKSDAEILNQFEKKKK